MKLEPKAKPIKIRIKLGNSEFSSLDDVKKNFELSGLYPLFRDGRLERWLKQIGEPKIAENIKGIVGQYEEGDLRDYILLLSVFYEDVAESLSHVNINDFSSLDNCLSFLSLDALEKIYDQAKKEFNWENHLKSMFSREDIISLFESKFFRKIYSEIGDQWGAKMSQFVESDEDYIRFFDCIDMFVRKNPEHVNMLSGYFYSLQDAGYDWGKLYGKIDLKKVLYWYSKPIFRQNCVIDWKAIVSPFLTAENIKEVFESPDHHSIYGDNWGYEFAKLVTNKEIYSDFLKYLINYTQKNGCVKKCKTLISEFYDHTSKNGYNWLEIFGQTLDDIEYVYHNKYFQNLEDIKWGEIFAEVMSNWDKEHQQIETVLKPKHLDSFYQYCANKKGIKTANKKGIKTAEKKLENKLDLWSSLVNIEEDYKNVSKALTEWKYDDKKWNKKKYHYSRMKSILGKQILDILEALIIYPNSLDTIVLADPFLNDIRKVLVASERRTYDNKKGLLTLLDENSINILERILTTSIWGATGPSALATFKTTRDLFPVRKKAVYLISRKLEISRKLKSS